MHRINLFVEDRGHEVFLQALLHRLKNTYNVTIEARFANARGGHGKVLTKLKSYMNELKNDEEHLPDLLIVAIDGNGS